MGQPSQEAVVPKTSQSPEAILRTCEVPLKTVLTGAGHSHTVLFFMG